MVSFHRFSVSRVAVVSRVLGGETTETGEREQKIIPKFSTPLILQGV